MVKASVYIATSLDGFIARPDGALDWLNGWQASAQDGDYGYQAFMDSVDVIVIGRATFETVLSFGQWPYAKKVVVLSSRPAPDLPLLAQEQIEWLGLAPRALVDHLAAQGAQHLYVDGGKTVQGFLNAGLIDEIILTRIPILIGAGIPLFGAVTHDIRLHAIETRQFDSGMVQTRYCCVKRET